MIFLCSAQKVLCTIILYCTFIRNRRVSLNSILAPLTLRGGLGTVNQLAVTVGLLISQVLGVENLLGNDTGWPYLLGVAVFPSILQMILLPLCPESPRHLLISKGQEQAARDGKYSTVSNCRVALNKRCRVENCKN